MEIASHSVIDIGGHQITYQHPDEGEWIADALLIVRYTYLDEDGRLKDGVGLYPSTNLTGTVTVGMLSRAQAFNEIGDY